MPVQLADIEKLIDHSNPTIQSDFRGWDKTNCNVVGLTTILLKQVILEEIKGRGEWYDGEFDELLQKLG